MANQFVRRNTKVELDIEGNLFTVDFGRDDIPRIIADLNQGVEALEVKLQEEADLLKREEVGLEKTKKLFQEAINKILQDDTASDRIFKHNDYSGYYADVYTFLIEEYTKAVAKTKQDYNPNRAERRGGK